MSSGSFESKKYDTDVAALYGLAETMCDSADGFTRYDYAKSVWIGSPDRQLRLNGAHPWPSRVRNGERYVYSVPVLAAINAQSSTMLYVGKDNWKEVNDPNAWLVAERNLLHGDEIDHRVLTASVDAANDVRLTLAPASYDNMPPLIREAMCRRPMYDQTVLSGRLDERYNLSRATVKEGLESVTTFEDIEALESMIVFVQQLRRINVTQQNAMPEATVAPSYSAMTGVVLRAA